MVSDPYLEPYRQSEREHGSDFEVTLWASRDTQERRFDVFTQMCYMHDKRVLDAGCSRGDLAGFLLAREVHYASYVGLDGLENVIEYARGRRLPRCEFVHGDFVAEPSLLKTRDPQVVCISGTLNTMSDDQVFATLDAAWDAASETLLFNFLSDEAGPGAPAQTGPARRLPALKLLRWALTKTPLVTYRQDYFAHGHDATIMAHRVRT